MPTPKLCNPKPFKDQFRKDVRNRKERRYCFILGAGASVGSGIPSGVHLASTWLTELYERECPMDAGAAPRPSLKQWYLSTECPHKGIDPDNPGAHYPDLFRARFPNDDPEGQRFIQEVIRGLNPNKPNIPSIGYAYLALLLEQTPSKYVITTNFDNLAADALLQLTGSLPRVIGHERVAHFAELRDGQPVIAKIHGDTGFVTSNTPESVSALPAEWQGPLKTVLRDNIPLVIGYDGNDGSLMDFLATQMVEEGPRGEKRSLFKSGLYWCYQDAPGKSWGERLERNAKLQALCAAHQVHFVPIGNFDLWMMELGLACDVGDPATVLKTNQDRRLSELRAQIDRARSDQATAGATSAIEASRKEARQTISKTSAAWKLVYEAQEMASKDSLQAQRLFDEAIKLAPNEPGILGNFANFQTDVRKDFDKAQALYERAIAADPSHPTNLGNFALFQKSVRKDFDKAQALYERAVAADPNHANNLGNFASFQSNVRKDFDKAQALYERAAAADPSNASILGNFANFQSNVRKDFDKAEALYERAVAADPNDANILGNFATFQSNVRKDFDKAQALYERAIAAGPNHANNLGNFATFQKDVRKDFDKAQALYERAIAADTKNADQLGNFAGFLLATGGIESGRNYLSRARALLGAEHSPLAAELWFYSYAHGDHALRSQALLALKQLVLEGVRSPGWDFSLNIERAQTDGHEDADWLQPLAKVVNGEAEPSTLREWERWKNAPDVPPK